VKLNSGLDAMEQSPSEKLIVAEIVKKFTAFYETKMFIATGHRPEAHPSSTHVATLFP
jgi:hypothetical protein